MASNNASVEARGPIDANKPGADNLQNGLGNNQGNGAETAPAAPERKKKPSIFSTAKAKLGLNRAVIIPMFKGSLPPIIAIAMCQSTAVADYFTTLGYLIPIISVFGLAQIGRAHV